MSSNLTASARTSTHTASNRFKTRFSHREAGFSLSHVIALHPRTTQLLLVLSLVAPSEPKSDTNNYDQRGHMALTATFIKTPSTVAKQLATSTATALWQSKFGTRIVRHTFKRYAEHRHMAIA